MGKFEPFDDTAKGLKRTMQLVFFALRHPLRFVLVCRNRRRDQVFPEPNTVLVVGSLLALLSCKVFAEVVILRQSAVLLVMSGTATFARGYRPPIVEHLPLKDPFANALGVLQGGLEELVTSGVPSYVALLGILHGTRILFFRGMARREAAAEVLNWMKYTIGLSTAFGASVFIVTQWLWLRFVETFEQADEILLVMPLACALLYAILVRAFFYRTKRKLIPSILAILVCLASMAGITMIGIFAARDELADFQSLTRKYAPSELVSMRLITLRPSGHEKELSLLVENNSVSQTVYIKEIGHKLRLANHGGLLVDPQGEPVHTRIIRPIVTDWESKGGPLMRLGPGQSSWIVLRFALERDSEGKFLDDATGDSGGNLQADFVLATFPAEQVSHETGFFAQFLVPRELIIQ